MIKIFKEGKPKDFQTYNKLPKSKEQSMDWQNYNRSWWEKIRCVMTLLKRFHSNSLRKNSIKKLILG